MIVQTPRLYLPQHFNAAAYYDAMSMNGSGGVLSNFAAVSSWKDLSGKGRDLTQATGANQPQYTTNIINTSGNSVLFDGASRYLSSGVSSYAGEITIMFLGTLNNSAAVRRFVSYGANGGVSVGTPSSAGLSANFTTNAVQEINTSSNFYATGAFVVLTAVLRNPSGATWVVDFYKNGVAFQTGISISAPVASSSNFIVGAFSSSSAFWLGQLAMLAIWERVLTTFELNEMHMLFKTRGNL